MIPQRYSDEISQRLTGRHKKSLKLLFALHSSLVLDIGCYNGWLEYYFYKENCSPIIGIDLEENYLKMAKQHAPSAHYLLASGLNLPFRLNSFHAVVAFDVLEHLLKDQEIVFLNESYKTLRSNGTMILSTPNDALTLKLVDPAWLFGHRHYSKTVLCSFLNKTQFSIIDLESRGGFYENFSMLLFYPFKLMGREIPLKSYFDRQRDFEYLEMNTGKSTVFLTIRK